MAVGNGGPRSPARSARSMTSPSLCGGSRSGGTAVAIPCASGEREPSTRLDPRGCHGKRLRPERWTEVAHRRPRGGSKSPSCKGEGGRQACLARLSSTQAQVDAGGSRPRPDAPEAHGAAHTLRRLRRLRDDPQPRLRWMRRERLRPRRAGTGDRIRVARAGNALAPPRDLESRPSALRARED